MLYVLWTLKWILLHDEYKDDCYVDIEVCRFGFFAGTTEWVERKTPRCKPIKPVVKPVLDTFSVEPDSHDIFKPDITIEHQELSDIIVGMSLSEPHHAYEVNSEICLLACLSQLETVENKTEKGNWNRKTETENLKSKPKISSNACKSSSWLATSYLHILFIIFVQNSNVCICSWLVILASYQ